MKYWCGMFINYRGGVSISEVRPEIVGAVCPSIVGMGYCNWRGVSMLLGGVSMPGPSLSEQFVNQPRRNRRNLWIAQKNIRNG